MNPFRPGIGRSSRAISLALVLLSPRLYGQEPVLENSWEEEADSQPEWTDQISPEEYNEMEELQQLEDQLLEDLQVHQPRLWFSTEACAGVSEHLVPLGATTFYRVPGVQGGLHSIDSPRDPLHPGERESGRTSLAGRLPGRFDLSGLQPLFGLEHLEYDQIQVYLHFYTTRGRRHLANTLARGGRYRQMIRQELRNAGLPQELYYLALVESGFNPIARSRAGAVGLWQFMPATGRGEGLIVSRTFDQRRDPEASTQAAVQHLASLYDRFGSWTLAMAAYNAGSGHVSSEIRRYNVNDFWRMDGYSAIYDDTRRYVYRIIAAALIGEHPELFGFDGIVLEPPQRYDTVEVPGNTRLSVFSRALDISVDRLMELNPSLLVARTPDVETFALDIPFGSESQFVQRYDRFDPSEVGQGHLHRLRFGETLEHLSEIYGINGRVIRVANGLARREVLPYGSEVVIPLEESDAQRRLRDLPSGGGLMGQEMPVVITPAIQFDYPDRQRLFYQVQATDEIHQVADAFGVTSYDLALWNDVDPAAELLAGMVLQVFPSPETDLSQVRYLAGDQVRILALGSPEFAAWDQEQQQRSLGRRRHYTVRRGDTVSSIARRFGVRSSDIIRWNDLDDPDHIRAGQRIRVR
ncbi:MAG: transglycosylase SLT domain-containing protein [Bradymonadales bacterium]|nr:transglycosylase SLT domain-containing protein [Bradymonadales bacterium]